MVKKIKSSDGIGGNYSRTFTYEQARLDVQGRGFLGFGTRTDTDSRDSTQYVTTSFQSFPYIGMVNVSKRIIAGTTPVTVEQVTNTVSQKTYGSGTESRTFPYFSKSVAIDRELDNTKIRTTTTDRVLTVYGGTSDETVTVVDNTSQAWQRHITRDFDLTSELSSWCLRRPYAESVTMTLPDATYQTRSATAVPDYGMCRLTSYTDQPGNLQVLTELEYDSWGNVNKSTVTGFSMAARVTQYDFTPGGTKLTTKTNPLNQQEHLTWDYDRGTVATYKDVNDLQTTFEYDGFGELTKQIHPDTSFTEWDRTWCSLGCNLTTGVYKALVTTQNAGETEVGSKFEEIRDGLDRILQHKDFLLGGVRGIRRVEYDSFGRVYRDSLPFDTGAQIFWRSRSYDPLGRILTLDTPLNEGQVSGRIFTYDYSTVGGLLVYGVTTPAPASQRSEKRMNAIGQVVRSVDASSNTVDYGYFPFGELKQTQDDAGNVVARTYDTRGNPASVTDPDMGGVSKPWYYVFNALGELGSQKDAKLQETTYTYDKLSRIKKRIETEGTTTWTWDTASGKGVGKLASVSSPGSYDEYFVYDSLGRPSVNTTSIGTELFSIDFAYDGFSRPRTLTYPIVNGSRFAVQYNYDSVSGVLTSVVNAATPSSTFWTLNTVNSFGQITQETEGNGLATTRDYDLARGYLESIKAGPTNNIQNLGYVWDAVDRLTTRSELRQGITETFTYDTLDRLDKVKRNNILKLDLDVNDIGNITTSNVAGTYVYGGSKPHAATSVGGTSLSYDANGNMNTKGTKTVSWTSYNYPAMMTAGTESETFAYNAWRDYFKRTTASFGTLTTTLYVGGIFERVTTGSSVQNRHLIVAAGAVIGQRTIRSDGTQDTYYFHSDHLGSLDAITNAAGTLVVRASFDALGNRRGNAWQGTPTAADLSTLKSITSFGFTGHRMLDGVGLIHMNGRAYDPAIGRMISADPTIPEAFNLQAFNRYSYVANNPLNFTDPSGFNWYDPVGDVIEDIAGFYLDKINPFFALTSFSISDGAVVPTGAFNLVATYIEFVKWQHRRISPAPARPAVMNLSPGQDIARQGNASSDGGYGTTDDAVFLNGVTSDFGWEDAAILLWPGYDLGTCISNGECSRLEWGLAVLGTIPGGKAESLGAKALIKQLLEVHHLLPQAKRFRKFFEKAGLNIEDFTVQLDRADHRLNPSGIHTKAGGNWNAVWDEFFEANPNATKDQILQQLERMRKDFGI